MQTQKQIIMDYIEELKSYLKNTPREEIQKEWDKTQQYDEIGPTVKDFLEYSYALQRVRLNKPLINVKSKDISPKFSSGFFIY